MTFRKLANTIERNAPMYHSLTACNLMAGRLKRAYAKAGGLGVEFHIYRDALWAIQLRAVALQGEQLDEKYGTEDTQETN